MAESLKEKAINGVLWSFLGKFGSLFVSFVSNLVLARLLVPENWGCIGMLTIFIGISQVFVTSGLGSALIQKKDASRLDFTTVFYYNLVVALFFMGLLYVGAPWVARFYDMPLLCDVLRVQSLSVLLSSLSLVPAIQLQKDLRFKQLNIRHLIASTCGAIVAIIMALNGYGVWSLVANGLTLSLVSTLLLWKMSSWRPTWEFSWLSFKQLFSYGVMILVSSLVESLFRNVQGLIIGKMYTPKTLGYYDQARKLEQLPTSTLSSVVETVSFPIVAKIQDDKERVKEALGTQYKTVTFLNFPLMFLLFVVALPLVQVLYGDKWTPSVPYFQVLCLSGLVYNISTLSTSTIRAIGEAKVYLKMQIIKRLIGLALIIVGACIGIWAMMMAVLVSNYVYLVINIIVIRKYVGYGFRRLISDMMPIFLTALVVAVPVGLFVYMVHIPEIWRLLIGSLFYVGAYLILVTLFGIETRKVYWDIVRRKLLHRK